MKSKKILLVLLLFSSHALTAETGRKKSFTVQLGGSGSSGFQMRDLMKDKPIAFPRGSELIFTATTYCGDGDVAAYYASNPQEDSAVGMRTFPVAVGYWFEPVGSAAGLPRPENWHLIGSGTVSANSITNKLKRANSTTEDSAYEVVMTEITQALAQLSAAPSGQSYKLSAAAMICRSFQDSSGVAVSQDSPTSGKIAAFLIQSKLTMRTMAQQFLSEKRLAELLNVNQLPMNIEYQNGQLLFSQSGSGHQSDYEKNVLSEFRELKYPSSAKNWGEFRDAIKNQLSRIQAAVNAEKNRFSNTQTRFWWEGVPLNLTSQLIDSNALQRAIDHLMGGDIPDSSRSLPSQNEYESLVKEFAVQILPSVMMESAQSEFNFNTTRYVKNKARCFPVGEMYINKILASYGFRMSVGSSNNVTMTDPGGISHPEGNYALGGYAPYRSDTNAVFMNSLGSVLSVTLEAGKNYYFSIPSAQYFKFHLRDIGCGDGIFYCHNITETMKKWN
ncbi:MAG: hypothetical protein BroJett040_15850 [Oligoflexia bacterium]|nr:MAG: hypothetical protein BroJett040_15850 [Oligoflexia bacterium]